MFFTKISISKRLKLAKKQNDRSTKTQINRKKILSYRCTNSCWNLKEAKQDCFEAFEMFYFLGNFVSRFFKSNSFLKN